MSNDFQEMLTEFYRDLSARFMELIVPMVVDRWGESVALFTNSDRYSMLSLTAALYNGRTKLTSFELITVKDVWEHGSNSIRLFVGGRELDPANPDFNLEYVIDTTMEFIEQQVLTHPTLKLDHARI